VPDNNDCLERTNLKERELARIFNNIDDEIALITANAKFNFTIQKTTELDLKIMLSYIEDTQKLVELLKVRMSLLSAATS
jgi:hypothetical protein